MYIDNNKITSCSISDNNRNNENIIVSFIVIALNASSSLNTLFKCIKQQTYPHNKMEIILVDGMSSDDTKARMLDFQNEDKSFTRIVVLDNPKKTLPCGWNVALSEVRGNAVLRVDAHTTFPKDFVEKNVISLEKGEDICGGKVISIPVNTNKWCIMLNEAENSLFGGGIASFRHSDVSKYVSTLAFAIYKRAVFDKVGQYNEILTRTEDNEMHYRMKQAGFKFFYNPNIVSYRETRSTLWQLLKQKYLNGYWVGRTLWIEPKCFSLYHLVPFFFVLSILVSGTMIKFNIIKPAIILCFSYFLVNLIMTLISMIKNKERNPFFVFLPFIFFILHFGYGLGTLVGVSQK